MMADRAFHQFVRAVYPPDGSAGLNRDQALDLELKLNIFEAGPTDGVSLTFLLFDHVVEPSLPHISSARDSQN
jgi:hypothetical protein